MEEKSRNGIMRASIAGIAFLLQLAWILFEVNRLNAAFYPVEIATRIFAFLVVFRVFGKHVNAAVKIPWIIILLVLPITGLIIYLLFGSRFSLLYVKKKFKYVNGLFDHLLVKDDTIMDILKKTNLDAYGQAHYIEKYGKYPSYANDEIEYFPDAALGLKSQLEELAKAEKFIFMEYHAIEDSKSFHDIEKILVEKANKGVDVRIIYDDMGSIGFISTPFKDRLEKLGIKCRVFNPIMPILNIFMNNRDHRKMTIIDGKVGFTGGYNLADEYFNLVSPYGHWKDTGIKIKGKSVDNLTVMFLEMWSAIKFEHEDTKNITNFINQVEPDEVDRREILEDDYYVIQPFGDMPLDEEKVSENVYLNLAKNAKEYLYITTPYLLIDDNMNDELTLAAKRGVDVRIITPGIPDKKPIYHMTRSYYAALARHGVRIYEYTPGFIHAKQHISDDRFGVIGTINMDYRSLYLHFENGVFMFNTPIIKDMKKDFEETMAVSREVTKKYANDRSTALRIGQCFLRLFAPLM